MRTDTAVKSDLDTLRDLNRDYIRSVQTSDVRRFDEILADDFLCSSPDGSLVDRSAFLKQTALPGRDAGSPSPPTSPAAEGRARMRRAFDL